MNRILKPYIIKMQVDALAPDAESALEEARKMLRNPDKYESAIRCTMENTILGTTIFINPKWLVRKPVTYGHH